MQPLPQHLFTAALPPPRPSRPLAPGAAVSLEEGLQPRDWARELTRLDTLTPEAMNAQLCLSYTHATPDQVHKRCCQDE
jgi:hypothetical protein